MITADEQALSLISAVEPVFTGLVRTRDVIDIPGRYILHAGPPIDARDLPAVILNSAVIAILFEGWAESGDQAHRLLLDGEIKLAPAQENAAAVPLASVLSPSMWAQCVRDARNTDRCAYSPINGGAGPALRLGMSGDSVLEHLKWVNGDFADWMTAAVGERQIPLIPVADLGLEQGDDCHGRTVAATQHIAALLSASERPDNSIAVFLEEGPSFFLNLWMAATRCMLSAAAGCADSTVVTVAGGNGIEFGVQLAGSPGRWSTTEALVPEGIFNPGFSETDGIGAIGDSAIIDIFGFGAMAVSFSSAQAVALARVLPESARELPSRLLDSIHPGFDRCAPRFGLSAQKVAETETAPVIALGILDKSGINGRIGGGIYRPPVSLFVDALSDK